MALKAGADAVAAELTALGERELHDRILTRPLPRHVAIIMDGNGRWATSRGMPRVAGHAEGVKAVRNTVRAAGAVGIEYLTLYAFSSENWKRPSHEVSTLMNLLERSIDRELPELMERNVRFRVIGRPNGVPPEVQRRIDHVVDATAANTGLTLLMAFNYGARDEIVDACRRLARDVRAGQVEPEEIDEVRVGRALYTDGVPDPDLLIRTSGEMRVSNFLLWQIAYTELWVTPTRWPDFAARGVPMAAPVDARGSSRAGELARRVLSTAVLLPAFVWILIGAPAWAFTILIVGVGMLANWEFTRMFARAGVPVLRDAGLIWGGLVTLAFVRPDRAGAAFAVVVIGLLVASLDRGSAGVMRWQRVAVTLLAVCYVNWLLGHTILLRALPDGIHWILLLVWVTWLGETAAYAVGSRIGRHKLAP